MRIEQLKLALRRRTPWEALDLGLIMLRHWHRPIYRVWFGTFVPFTLLTLAALWQSPSIAFFIIWWTKPLFDRLLLKVFAEASIGEPPSLRDVWRALPQLLRHSGLIAGLSFRRFSFARSFELPVWQLEGQNNKGGRARLRVLSRKTRGYASWLTIVCLHVVAIFEFGLIGLLDLLLPTGGVATIPWQEIFFGEEYDNFVLLFNFAWLVAESIVEPYYVAAGFSLYLNRRSELEGWDIEVTFRKMSEKHRPTSPASPASPSPSAMQRTLLAALLAIGLSCLSIAPGPACAEEDAPTPIQETANVLPQTDPVALQNPDGRVRQLAQKILSDPVFGQKTEELGWRQRQKEQPPEEKSWWEDYLIPLAKMLAQGARGLIYLLIALAVAGLLVLIYRNRHLLPNVELPKKRPLETLFGLDLRPDSLPADIAGTALAEIEAGRYAAGLSLLYRGTLVWLIKNQHIDFRSGDTENSCLHRASAHIDAPSSLYFARLLEAWKRTAYAHTPPDAANAKGLCLDWAKHFAQKMQGQDKTS